MDDLLVKKFWVKVYPMLSQKKRYRLGLYHLESHQNWKKGHYNFLKKYTVFLQKTKLLYFFRIFFSENIHSENLKSPKYIYIKIISHNSRPCVKLFLSSSLASSSNASLVSLKLHRNEFMCCDFSHDPSENENWIVDSSSLRVRCRKMDPSMWQ